MISAKFLKSTLSYSIAGSLPMLAGFILLPFYTNYLSTADYGMLMLYIAFSLFVQALTSYSVDAYIGAHYSEVKDDEVRRKELISNATGLLLIIGLIFIGTMVLLGKPLFNLSFNRSGQLSFYPYGFMSVITGFFNGFFRVYTYLLVFEKKPGAYFLLNLLSFGLTILLSIIGIFLFPESLIGPMTARLLSGAAIFLFALIGFWKIGGISFRVSSLKGLHAFCIPYVLYVLLTWVAGNVDRFMINDLINPENVAVFDFAVKCTLLIDFVQTGMISAIYPEVFGTWTKTQAVGTSKETNRYFHAFTGLTLILTCLFMIFIPLILPLVVKNKDFYGSFVFMGVLAGSFATRGMYYFCVSIILHLKKTRVLLAAFAVSVTIQLPATFWLTKLWGIEGTVIAALLAKIIQVVVLYYFARRLFVIQMNIFKLVVTPLFLVAALCAIWYFMDGWSVYPYLALSAVVVVILFFQYRNEISLLAGKFMQKKNRGNAS